MQTTPIIPPMTSVRPSVQESTVEDSDQQRREQAIKRIQDKNAVNIHLLVYLVINAAFVAVWALSGFGYFWPVFSIVAWGAGVAVHAYCVYVGNDKSGFIIHLATYLIMNAWFVVMWALSGVSLFWPIFAILLWGAGVAIHGYSVYSGASRMTETQIEREMKRLS